jgi:alpha-1,2-mannosyltransferase
MRARPSVKRDPYARVTNAIAVMILAIGIVFTATTVVRRVAGDSLSVAAKSSSLIDFRLLFQWAWVDSLGAMFAAHDRATHDPQNSVYASVLEVDGCRFQYPPSSLLILDLLPPLDTGGFNCKWDDEKLKVLDRWAPRSFFDIASGIAIVITAALMALTLDNALLMSMGQTASRSSSSGQRKAASAAPTRVDLRRRSVLLAGTFVLAITFYPLTWGYEIGQIQVYLNLFMSLALLCYLRGNVGWAGVFVGLCCVYKPQYAVIVIWGLYRRNWRFSVAVVFIAGAATLLAIWRYGVPMHVEYVQFVRALARHGEVFWSNQSVNGILNRFLLNGNPMQWADVAFPTHTPPEYASPGDLIFKWDHAGFPPYNPVVYWSTVISSLAFIALALKKPAGSTPSDMAASAQGGLSGALDLALIYIAATIAAPIAWQHHYGSFVSAYAIALAALALTPGRRPLLLWLLGASFLLMTCTFLRPELIFTNRWLGLLGSTLWLGAAMLFCIVFALRRRASPP